jgi:hypothetical protein
MPWLLLLPLLRKSGGKTNNVVYVKTSLAKSQSIFKPKSPQLLSQDSFLYRDDAKVNAATAVHTVISVQGFK